MAPGSPAPIRAAVRGLASPRCSLAGCAGWTTDPALTLHVDSAIDRPLLVYVNDDWVGTIPAGATDADGPRLRARRAALDGRGPRRQRDRPDHAAHPGRAGPGRRAHDDGRDRLRHDHDDRRRAGSRAVAGPAGAGRRAAPCD